MVGKGKDQGGLSGSVRNPEKYCSRQNCNNYQVKGSPLCRIHGASRVVAARRVAAVDIAREAGLATIEPKDFPRVVGELVGWHLLMVRELQQELDDLRIIGDPITLARDYADILDRLDKSSASVSKLLGSIAALGIADAFQQQAQAMTRDERNDRVNRLMALTMEADSTGPMWCCPTCGRGCCSQVLEAEIVEELGDVG